MSRACVIKWVAEDVHTLRPEWTLDQCQEWLDRNGKYIQDRSVELGWEIIECLLPAKGKGPEED